MRKVIGAIGAMLAILAASGCSGGAAVADATKEIDHFHQQLDAGQIEAIWDAASPELRGAIDHDKFVAFLSAVHKKLGPLKSSSKAGWNVNYTTAGVECTPLVRHG